MRETSHSKQPVVRVEELAIGYATRQGLVRAVRDVSFEIRRGETLGIVGESGCGKSTVAYGLVNYLGKNGRIVHGDIIFQGQSLVGRSPEELRRLRGDQISMVYQDPMTSLNPVMPIGAQMAEVLTVHRKMAQDEARRRCLAMLTKVAMPDPEAVLARYPHQISGGQQQRVVIAMALLNDPALLIMDEPTTALDVTVEAAVLDLVVQLRKEFDTAILFISHNLGVVARVCDRVAVMYAGEVVELAPVREIFANPRHPYTQGLIRCVPKIAHTKGESVLYPIPGRVPAPDSLPAGCTFEPRCQYAIEACHQQRVALAPLSPSHASRCIRSHEIDAQAWLPPDVEVPSLTAVTSGATDGPVLQVKALNTYYKQGGGGILGLTKRPPVRAVDGVSFSVARGVTLGIVGESGCGKSTLIKTVIGLEERTAGTIELMGVDIGKLSRRSLATIREMQMVFQNPDATLNPSYAVGQQIARPLRRLAGVPKAQVRAEVIKLLRAVKLDEYYYDRLPRQLSGGEKQRIGIARALAGQPDVILCDEPVSALDVSVQAAVLNLLGELQQANQMTMLFIAHDLSVVRTITDYVAVMYLGRIVEIGPSSAIYAPPFHPYTESLLAAVPVPDPTVKQAHIRLGGTPPSPANPPSGCRFHTRCPRRSLLPAGGNICTEEEPPWRDVASDHQIACHLTLEQLAAIEPVFSFGKEE
ncbi:MAG: ABC transporter ATP-binding protein [Candidatus Viridilinea halotolerans]|uniref:ABC transporter ATP-binding protein n=1 Tax=Candidatus Viridilinea halotolerans TaxID=2491704 RepID=A0A426TQN4_9CHLR|nr:MAG: ABC transporter ATP-binding protein [Candidatus Viridilinea halotolerans]